VALMDAGARLIVPEQTLTLKSTNTFLWRAPAGRVSLEINGTPCFRELPDTTSR
jgi:hypothetical protein